MLMILKSMLSWQVCNTHFLNWKKMCKSVSFSLFQWVRIAEQCFLLHRSYVLHRQLQLISDILLKWLFFFSSSKWQMSLGYSLLNSCCKLLKSNKFKANLIDAVDFDHAKRFSVIYLELHLESAEHCSKLASKLWSTFPEETFAHHTIMKFAISWLVWNPPSESSQWCMQWPKQNPFQHVWN